ncbi:hypothetical protein N0V91_006928 [Didymella pomorum]|uniref:Uncharacterized protein n=1 Tax=Didymella pomorum TaxID=749634 RepID=A0A9W8ZA37_9PLEO|nr:hypothetical protein N0V91_006928 [Didymella pomorum]
MEEDALVAIASEGSNDVTSLAIVVLERIPVADEADNDLVVSLKPEGAAPEIGDPDEPGWTTVVDDGTAEVGREGGMDTVDVASTKEVTGGPTSLALESLAVVLLGSWSIGLLDVAKVGQIADDGAGRASSKVPVADSENEAAGGANIVETSIDDAALEGVGVCITAEVSKMLEVITVVDSDAALDVLPIENPLEARVTAVDVIGADAVLEATENTTLEIGKSATSDEGPILELNS